MEERGAPQEVIDAASTPLINFEVMEENEIALDIFQRLTSQWIWSSGGGCVGLNYQSIDFLFKLYSIKERKRIFEEIQIMEFAALAVFNEQKD